MTATRVVFEHGIELRLKVKHWEISNTPSRKKTTFPSLQDATVALEPLRPLLMSEKKDNRDDIFLIRLNGENFGDSITQIIRPSLTADASLFLTFHNLVYLLGAVQYHCHQLAELYVRIAAKHNDITRRIRFFKFSNSINFGNQAAPYYELEALIGAARRSYDALRYILWRRFGNAEHPTPRSLEVLLKNRYEIPEQLYRQLKTSWETHGTLLTHYRNCIHHYVPIDYALASASMRRCSLGIWTTTIPIPDNPETRSKKKFTYDLNRDALTYAWELSNEILDVVLVTADAVLPRMNGT